MEPTTAFLLGWFMAHSHETDPVIAEQKAAQAVALLTKILFALPIIDMAIMAGAVIYFVARPSSRSSGIMIAALVLVIVSAIAAIVLGRLL